MRPLHAVAEATRTLSLALSHIRQLAAFGGAWFRQWRAEHQERQATESLGYRCYVLQLGDVEVREQIAIVESQLDEGIFDKQERAALKRQRVQLVGQLAHWALASAEAQGRSVVGSASNVDQRRAESNQRRAEARAAKQALSRAGQGAKLRLAAGYGMLLLAILSAGRLAIGG